MKKGKPISNIDEVEKLAKLEQRNSKLGLI